MAHLRWKPRTTIAATPDHHPVKAAIKMRARLGDGFNPAVQHDFQIRIIGLYLVNQFIILPLSYLSGTFYHIDILPPVFQKISLCNPLFYLIDGFRYGFLGESDGNIMIGVILAAVINICLFIAVLTAFKKGWRIKS